MCFRGNRLAWGSTGFHSLLQHGAAGPSHQMLWRLWEHLSHSIPSSGLSFMVYYFAPPNEFVLPVDQKVLPLVTLQANSFPLAKLSFSWLRSIQGNSFLGQVSHCSVQLTVTSFSTCGRSWDGFILQSMRKTLLHCAVFIVSSHTFLSSWVNGFGGEHLSWFLGSICTWIVHDRFSGSCSKTPQTCGPSFVAYYLGYYPIIWIVCAVESSCIQWGPFAQM